MTRESCRQGPFATLVVRACELSAVMGGLVLLALVGMTVYSIAGRHVAATPALAPLPLLRILRPVPGDFELVELGTAIAVFCFLPYCQVRRGNVIVDLFTRRIPAPLKSLAAAAGDLVFALTAALLAWRLALGAADLRRYAETTMVLRIPAWWAYVPCVATLALLSLACLFTAWESLGRRRR